MEVPTVDYNEVKNLPRNLEKYLVDVRELAEIEESGRIPSSINIPLNSITTELAPVVTTSQFQEKYGIPKPILNAYIILYCRSGRRSLIAAKSLIDIGYTNIHNYSGSWLDWVEREGQSTKK